MRNIPGLKILTVFFLLPAFIRAAYPVSSQTDELYRKGIEALRSKDTIRAEEYFKESIRANADAPSYFELAKIDLERNTFVSRNRAYENFRMAVWKDPLNIKYKYQYAEICKDFARFEAIKVYEEIIKIDSAELDAWVNLGGLSEKDFTEYDKSFRDVDGILAPLQEYADEDLRGAEKYYLRALSIDSANYNASLKLALLYEKSDRPDMGIPILRRLIQLKKDDQKIHLCLGLLYYKTSRLKESHSEYKKALELMSSGERLDFTLNSVKFLLEPKFESVMEKMDNSELENFIELYWKVTDPLYLTIYNERILEHYSRVAYANLRFGVPKMKITGWRSDRGEVILRYGEPLDRMRMRPQMGANSVAVKTDIWNYGGFTLGFTDMAQSGNFVFSAPAADKDKTASQFGGDTSTDIGNMRRNYFSFYEPKFEGPSFKAPVYLNQLKSYEIRNHTDLIVSYGLNAADSLLAGGTYNLEHELGIFFFDKNYEETAKKKEITGSYDGRRDLITAGAEKILVNSIDLPMRADSGFISVEIRRASDNGTSASRSNLRIRKFSSNRLDMSDLILASGVDPDTGTGNFVKRKELYIQPNPLRQFDADHRPYLYYELYNLAMNEKGLTDFEQNVTLSLIEDSDEYSSDKAFESIVNSPGFDTGNRKISLATNYQTQEKDPQIWFQLDLSGYAAGKYLVIVSVKDKVSGGEIWGKSVIEWGR